MRSRLPLLGVLLVAAIGVAIPSAGAQTDADLGCTYSMAPTKPGPVEYSNPVRLVIEGCSYPWDIFQVTLEEGAFITKVTASTEFECSDGDRVLCYRGERHADGASATMRPQCFDGDPVVATLSVSGSDPARTGATRTFPCVAPRMRTVTPPRRQSLRTALRRGVLAKFLCERACRARMSVSVYPTPSAGYQVGAKTFRRARGGTHAVRVPVKRAFHKSWRRRGRLTVKVHGTLRARSGEEVSGSYDVRLRR